MFLSFELFLFFLRVKIGAPIGPVIPYLTNYFTHFSFAVHEFFVLCLFFLNVLRTYHKQLSQL